MRAWQIQESFGLENLRLAELPSPEPGPRQLKLRVRAVSLNYRDWLTVAGSYNPRQPLPLIPFSDGVGEVVAVGEGVTRAKVGDRVCGLFCQDWDGGPPSRDRLRSTLGGPLSGMLAEEVLLDERGVIAPPEFLSDVEAATLPCAALTAWSALVDHGGLRAGQSVLVQGTGGVSIFALQFAKALGAEVLLISSSDEKLARAKDMGADHVCNYASEPEWDRWVQKTTGRRGVDVVVEVGGAGTLERSLRSVTLGGVVVVIGVLSGLETSMNIASLLMSQVRLQGILVGNRDGFAAMNRAIDRHEITPVVDRVFPFAQAPAALEFLQSGGHFGKIAIDVAGGDSS